MIAQFEKKSGVRYLIIRVGTLMHHLPAVWWRTLPVQQGACGL